MSTKRSGWRRYEDREEWLAARRLSMGSSDAAAIIGANRFRSALDVWREKVGLAEPQPDNRFTKSGRYLEPAVAQWFEDETGIVSTNPGDYAIYYSPEDQRFACTPDRLIIGPDPEDLEAAGIENVKGDGVLEIKTASAWLAEEWGDEPPTHYQIQVQYQLAVMGLQWGIIAILFGGNELRWYLIRRNERFASAMIQAMGEWWDKHVVPQEQPPPDLPRDLKTWEELHPGIEEREIELPSEYEAMDAEIQELREEEKQAEARRKALEAKLKAAIGDATLARLPSGVTFSYRTVAQEEKTILRKAFSFRKLTRRKPK